MSEAELKNPHIIQIEITELEKNGHAILLGHPCKILGIYPIVGFKGKRLQIQGTCIFTGKPHISNFRNPGKVDVPIVKRTDYSLIGIEDNFASLMDGEGNTREDLKLPSSEERGDLAEKIINAFEANQIVMVTVLEACGQEMIVDLKEDL